jgi:hypothetical protein
MSQTGENATYRFVDHGFLSMFITCFESIVYRSQNICVFCELSYGRLSISAARGSRKPEVKSPFDGSTTVFS